MTAKFSLSQSYFSYPTFVNRNENVIPLQRRMREATEAAIKDKNCET